MSKHVNIPLQMILSEEPECGDLNCCVICQHNTKAIKTNVTPNVFYECLLQPGGESDVVVQLPICSK